MHYQRWSKPRFWGVLMGVLFGGMLLQASISPTSQASQAASPTPTPRVATKVETRTVVDTSSAQKLKAVDDQIMTLAAQAIDLQNQTIQLAAEGFTFPDLDRMNQIAVQVKANTARMNDLTGQLSALKQQRQALLADLKL